MNTLSDFIEPLGWALLHFLWQGAAVALLLAVFLRLARRSGPQVRYVAAGVALLVMLGAAAGTVWWQVRTKERAYRADRPYVAYRTEGAVPATAPGRKVPAPENAAVGSLKAEPQPVMEPNMSVAPVEISPGPVPAEATLAERLRPVLPWLVGVWAAGVVLFSLRLVNGWRLVRRWRMSGNAGVPGEWAVRFAALCERMRLSRPVQLLSSAALTVPVVIGWLKPVVLVPAGLFSGIPAAQLEAILAHELAHVRRGDYLVNLLQTAVETVLFYHPAVWWASAQLRKEREHCCDDAAASLDGDAIGYARALTALEELRAVPTVGVSAAGGSLLQRVRRLAGLPQERAGVVWPLGILTIVAVGAALPFLLPRSEAGEAEKKTEAGGRAATGAIKSETGTVPSEAPPAKAPEMWIARAPLEGELKRLAFGETHVSGMRVAWAFDPSQETYALGSLLKCRVVFHNNGKQEIRFHTDGWHQEDTWMVKNAAGQEVKVKTVWYTGLTPLKEVRLKPGELYEVPAHGAGIGDGKYEEAYSTGTIGAQISAKEGDVLTCQWVVKLDHRIDPAWTPPPGEAPATLTTGAIRFKVAAAGTLIEPVTGVAKGTGKYDLAPGIKMQVTQTSTPGADGKTGYSNSATIEWSDANGKKALEWPIQLSAGQKIDPIVWKRGGTAIWIVHGLVVRRIDYTNAADVKETVIKMDEANHPDDAPPEVLQELVRIVAADLKRLETELEISVPEAEKAQEGRGKGELVINVRADGSIVLNQQKITLEELSQRLTEIQKVNAKQAIIIRGDVATPYEKIVKVLDATHKAGLYHVSFATMKPAEPAPAKDTAPSQEPETKPGDDPGKQPSGKPEFDARPTAPVYPFPNLEEGPAPEEKRSYEHKDGTRTETEWNKDTRQICETTSRKGVVIAKRVFYLDKKGQPRHGVIYDGRGNPMGTILYGYDKATGKTLEEQQYNKDGKLIRRLFYPGALKGPEYENRYVAFTIDPNDPKSTKLPALPPAEDEEDPAGKPAAPPDETKRHLKLADGFYGLGQYEKACEELDAVLKLDPGNADAVRLKTTIVAKMSPPKAEPASAAPDNSSPDSAPGISLTVSDGTGKVPMPEFRVIAGVRTGSAGGKDTINWQPHTLRTGKNGGLIWPLDKAYDEMALRVEADGYYPEVFQWIDKKKGSQDLFFQMKPSGPMRVHVLTPDGKPAVGAVAILAMVQRDAVLEGVKPRFLGLPPAASAADQWRRPRFFTADGDGGMQVERENDPTAAVLFTHESGVLEISFRALAEMESKQTVAGIPSLPVELKPWARVQGKVLWGDKQGGGQKVSLTIHRDDYGYPGIVAQYEKTTAAADGSFVFEKVLPGQVQLSCPITAAAGNKAGITEINVTGRIAHTVLKPGDNPVVIGGSGRTIKGKLTGRNNWDGVTFHFHPTAPHIGMPGDDEMWKAWGEFQKSPEGALYFREGLKVQADGTFEVTGVMPGDYQIFFKREGEDKYLAGGKFSLGAETAVKDPKAAEDIGEFKAGP